MRAAADIDAGAGVDLRRRAILVASLTAGGGLLIGALPEAALAAAKAGAAGAAAGLKPNAFVQVGRDGKVTVFMPYIEMGQGNYMAQAMVVAEELDVPLSSVVMQAAPADEKLYVNPLLGGQITGGSTAMRGVWQTMRAAGAGARIMLVQAAAQRWKVDPASCTTQDGQVLHEASGRRLRYGELVEAAARLPAPAEPALKKAEAYRIVGKSLPRLDSPAKINGSAGYGIDVRLPGMRYAMVANCPYFGGKLRTVDAAAAMKVRGVRQVVSLPDALAVVADSTWAAMKGLAALQIDWDPGANAQLSNADLVARADAALEKQGRVFKNTGDAAAAEQSAAYRYDTVYRLPALAHMTMEPMNCTVDLRAGRCEVWTGSQVVGRAQKVAAAAAGLPLEKVSVHNQYLGGGFGRRLEDDYVSQAVLFARQVKGAGPVKVLWSRAEDLQHDYYRGTNHSRITAALDAAGKPLSWRHRIVGPNIMARFLPVYQKDEIDLDIVESAIGPYDIPNVFIDFQRHEAPEGMHTGNWRGVGPTRNVFIVESAMDDLAFRARSDPVAYRRALLGNERERMRRVLDLAAERSGWGAPLPARSGRGVAIFEGFGSFIAMVAQVSVPASGAVKVERVTCAIDTGTCINPDIVKAQLEGGITFGVSSALHERVVVANGRVQQANFDAYRVLRMNEAPRVDVFIVDSSEAPGGVGEPGTAGAIAAVANAVFAATGVRATSLPLDPALFKVTS